MRTCLNQSSCKNLAYLSSSFCLYVYLIILLTSTGLCICRFSLAWWAYTFPMTGAAIATIRYSNEAVTNWLTRSLAIILSAIATLTVTGLLVTTLLHAFVFRDLFPNDIAIAIIDRPTKHHRKWPFHLRHGSSDTREIEQYLKFVQSEGKDLESSTEPSTEGASNGNI